MKLGLTEGCVVVDIGHIFCAGLCRVTGGFVHLCRRRRRRHVVTLTFGGLIRFHLPEGD